LGDLRSNKESSGSPGELHQGVVKWFNETKGFGFIESGDIQGDVFVHYTSIETTGFKTLQPGQEVSFYLVKNPRGLQTSRVFPNVK